jgi:hypothetical protein
VSWKGVIADTELGRLRAELDHARMFQRRIEREWARTLALIQDIDFDTIEPGRKLEGLRAATEIWHDLTLEPPRSVASHAIGAGLPSNGKERFGYLHRVFVGYGPDEYSDMCDRIEDRIDQVYSDTGPQTMPDLRDMIVELMELGVGTSTRSMEWLEAKIRELEKTS